MSLKLGLRKVCVVLFAAAGAAAVPSFAADTVKSVRLYALDCGRVDVKNMAIFADTGEYDGKPGNLAAPCFVVRHPKGTLVWDTGLPDKLAENKNGVDLDGGFHISRQVTLLEQLKALDVAPKDVTAVAFSHFHFDHTGNANVFDSSTWILNKTELAWAVADPAPFGVDSSSFSAYKTAKTKMIDGDYDVFGDGSVMILKAPGHTPGHQVLQLKLKKTGVVILSGDLYHTRDNRKYRRVPAFNYERADTLASIDRVEKIIANTRGRLVVQHDPVDFEALPKFPKYLD